MSTTNNTTVMVYAAIVDRTKVTLFHDGKSTTLLQGDSRIPHVIAQLKERAFNKNNPLPLDLKFEDQNKQVLEDFTSKNPFVKFYRLTKTALKGIFDRHSASEIADQDTGTYGTSGDSGTKEEGDKPAPKNPDAEVISQIQEAAKQQSESLTQPHDVTYVAVVNDAVAVAGVENVLEQVKHSVRHDTKAAANFFSRMAEISKTRKHTAEDLMKFLRAGDLPLAEDGSIIAYKVLYKAPRTPDGNILENTFVDPHTRRVHQKVGDRVCMDESLVDADRHRECSHGLHIGRVDYIRQFSGDTIFLIHINPEDVIAVPYADGSKMRVKAYHIIQKLPETIYRLLRNRGDILGDPEGKVILNRVLSGDFPAPVREVRITGSLGTGLKYTDLVEKATEAVFEEVPLEKPAEKPVEEAPNKDIKDVAEIIQPSSLENKQDTDKTPIVNKILDSDPVIAEKMKDGRQKVADFLMSKLHTAINKSQDPKTIRKAADELLKYKKEKKVSWDKLGISSAEAALVMQHANADTGKKPVKTVKTPKPPKIAKSKKAKK